MIVDRIRLFGEAAYLKDANGGLDLSATLPSVARTAPVSSGDHIEVGGIDLHIEGTDLWPYFQRQSSPICRVVVIKEVLPGLFVDPYRHRVHTICGFKDFEAGTFTNCRALEVDGEATIVALRAGPCRWISPRFVLSSPTSFAHVGWSFASARHVDNSAFAYTISMRGFDSTGNLLNLPPVAQSLGAATARCTSVALTNVKSFEVEFSADVATDGYLHEYHTAFPAPAGRALLRSLYLLEDVYGPYDFYSLAELIAASSRYDLFGASGGAPLSRMGLTVRLPATLAHSPNENVGLGLYESIGVEIDPAASMSGSLTYASARVEAQIFLRPDIDAPS